MEFNFASLEIRLRESLSKIDSEVKILCKSYLSRWGTQTQDEEILFHRLIKQYKIRLTPDENLEARVKVKFHLSQRQNLLNRNDESASILYSMSISNNICIIIFLFKVEMFEVIGK